MGFPEANLNCLTRFQNYVWISSGVKEKNTSKPRYNTIIIFLKNICGEVRYVLQYIQICCIENDYH